MSAAGAAPDQPAWLVGTSGVAPDQPASFGRQVVGEAPEEPAVAIIAHWVQRPFVNRAVRSARGDII